MWEPGFLDDLKQLAEEDAPPVAFADDLDFLFDEGDFTLDGVSFAEYDETVADDVSMATCPSCGHEFPL
jgi:hypothetical protein